MGAAAGVTAAAATREVRPQAGIWPTPAGSPAPAARPGLSRPAGTMGGVNQYGPATPVVEPMLMRANGLVAAEQGALWEAYLLTRGEGPHRLLLMPRDYAWRRLHDGLDAHGLRQEFTLLWKQLITRPEPSRSALDAVCAALLEPFAGPARSAGATSTP